MKVTVPPRDTPNRVAKLRQCKEAMNQLLCKTPYVEFSWRGDTFGERSLALLDSGADWSLIDETMMTEE